jgi:hypothetical protein
MWLLQVAVVVMDTKVAVVRVQYFMDGFPLKLQCLALLVQAMVQVQQVEQLTLVDLLQAVAVVVVQVVQMVQLHF